MSLLEIDDLNTAVSLHGEPLDPSDDGIDTLIRSILSCRRISRGFVEERFLERLSEAKLQNIFRALVRRPALESLKCCGLRDRSFTALVKAIRQSPHPPPLTRLWIIGLALAPTFSSTGSTSSTTGLELLIEALSNVPTLQAVNLLLIAPEGYTIESSVNVEFRSNEGILWEVGAFDHYSAVMIPRCFRYNSDRWTNIKVSGVDVSGVAIHAISDILASLDPSRSALDRMEIRLDACNQQAVRRIANVLAQQQDHRGLKELSLQVEENLQSSVPIMASISEMLVTNSCLEWLQLSRSLFHDQSACCLARCLTQNQTLKVLDLTYETPAGRHPVTEDKGYKALLEMLKVNQIVEVIPTYDLDHDSPVFDQIEYYLKLNESGVRRVQLSVNTHYEEFLELLESEGDDLDCVFYLLSKNPSLFRRMQAGP
ncbi:expressed unknown protein [Seminavis robusta]|uniref:Uncharacterized protein n=1 Tax=Seminavis robusta TaxID=568900 RepID=A0A9N8DBK8_9STRA|nr:expressed unknown protein [Seminavis robusta]|eukprot:Sro25_g017020.1 n/a (427) ;mRNA; f:95868-97148